MKLTVGPLEKDVSETGPGLESDIWQEVQVLNVLHSWQESRKPRWRAAACQAPSLTPLSLILGKSCPQSHCFVSETEHLITYLLLAFQP